jgi:hypothetical protein
MIDLSRVDNDREIIPLLHFEGIRFSSKTFEIEVKMIQVMIMNKPNNEAVCMIKKIVPTDKSLETKSQKEPEKEPEIIKEEINEFDWVNLDDDSVSLYNTIKYLLEKQGGKYWMENDDGAIKLWDDTGYYFSIDEPDFTIEAIRESLHNSISNINLDDEIHEEYLELVKVLEPIIGPFVNKRMEDLNESEEYDWIDTNPSNLSGQRLYDMMTELFKIQNDIYWIDNTII